MKENNHNNSGLSFSSVLTLIFIVLKLTGFINWSWLWVLAPTWISLLLFIVIAVLIADARR